MAVGDKKKPLRQRVGRVILTLVIWFLLAVVAAFIVAVIPNVRTCVERGRSGCWESIRDAIRIERVQPAVTGNIQPAGNNAQPTGSPETRIESRLSSAWVNLMDWVILVVSLIVAVRIMYPPEDLSTAPDT